MLFLYPRSVPMILDDEVLVSFEELPIRLDDGREHGSFSGVARIRLGLNMTFIDIELGDPIVNGVNHEDRTALREVRDHHREGYLHEMLRESFRRHHADEIADAVEHLRGRE